MGSTPASRRDIFRTIATTSHHEWPAYDTTPLYDRSSLSALQEDIRTVAAVWFAHRAHNSVDEHICGHPLQYVDFRPHDRYSGPATYEMRLLVRLFLLKEVHGWDHETALIEYLEHRPTVRRQFGLATIPDQPTLWRTWHDRFSTELQETIQNGAQTILINADSEGVPVPREPSETIQDSEIHDDASLTDHAVLNQADEITEQLSHLVYPAFSLNRGDSCEIHTNAFWDLQTYLGLREDLAANEGARSFLYGSNRERTPLGHAHRSHICDLSIDSIRKMYQAALKRLIDRVSETDLDPLQSIRPRQNRSQAIERATKTRYSVQKRVSTLTSGRPYSWLGKLFR